MIRTSIPGTAVAHRDFVLCRSGKPRPRQGRNGPAWRSWAFCDAVRRGRCCSRIVSALSRGNQPRIAKRRTTDGGPIKGSALPFVAGGRLREFRVYGRGPTCVGPILPLIRGVGRLRPASATHTLVLSLASGAMR